MSSNKKFLRLFLSLLILLWAGFIFSNSLENGAASAETSAKFIRFFCSRLMEDPKTAALAQFYVRNAAHFFEFFLLGILFYILFSGMKHPEIPAFFLTVTAAFMDEGLQLLSDRQSTLEDVAIDSCGAAVGILLMILIFRGIRKRKARKGTCKQP